MPLHDQLHPARKSRMIAISTGVLSHRTTSPTSKLNPTKSDVPKLVKRPPQTGIVREIDAHLNTYAATLATGFSEDLAEAERLAGQELEDLVADFEQSCRILAKVEGCLHEDIKDDSIREANLNDETGPAERLDSHMLKFRNDFTANRQKLSDLWKQWTNIQEEIACLAVEIFGKSILDIDHDISTEAQNAIKHALNLYEQQIAQADKDNTEVACIAAEVQKVSNESIETSKQQIKEIQIKKTKNLKTLCDSVEDWEDL